MSTARLTLYIALVVMATMSTLCTAAPTPTTASTAHPSTLSLGSRADVVMQRALQAVRDGRVGAVGSAAMYPSPEYVEQPQDHFDASNTHTWMQAFYVNATFWKGPDSGAPVFVCVGGEGPPLDGSVVVSSVHCNNAVEWLSETGALMLAVEHRYYGCHNMSACPVTSWDPALASLKYLSSRQALADLANFHDYAVKRWGLTSSNKWISWGGSYPGMLAGWFRVKYPNLIHGSVASSAPVSAQLDMRGYNDVVASAYSVADNNVGGSPACESAIAEGHASIKTMFGTASGREELSKLFGMPASFFADPGNQAGFAGNGVAYFPAQGNDPTCTMPGCNINEICKVMTDTSTGTPVARLAKLRSGQLAWMEPALTRAKDMDVGADSGVPDFWSYQTCTEFGFYQTCEVGSKCFYAQGYVTLASMDSFCEQDYGISQSEIAANINKTNAFYGGTNPNSTCILYPNGEVDPWHSLSILESPGHGIDVLMVPGASHHAWTHPSAPDDQPSVVAARTKIRASVTGFLKQDCTVP